MKSSHENAGQVRAVDFIIGKYKLLSLAAILLAVLAISSLLLAAIVPSFFSGSGVAEKVAVAALCGVIAIGLLLMLITSYVVIGHRANILDWGTYLAIIWLLPYFGIAIYLGGTALIRRIRRAESN